MLLLKRGGSMIYNGPLGPQSAAMISYFSAIKGVQPIADGYSEWSSVFRFSEVISRCRCEVIQRLGSSCLNIST